LSAQQGVDGGSAGHDGILKFAARTIGRSGAARSVLRTTHARRFHRPTISPGWCAVHQLFGLLAIPSSGGADPISRRVDLDLHQLSRASPEELYNSTTRLSRGAQRRLRPPHFRIYSDSSPVEITANFVPGTDPSLASVEVQNRIKRVEARLPRPVIQQGILVEEASSAVLQIVTLKSTDGSLDEIGLGDFMIRNVLGEIRRIPGVGRATLYSTERSLRIWVDPVKLSVQPHARRHQGDHAQNALWPPAASAPAERKDQAISRDLVKGSSPRPTVRGHVLRATRTARRPIARRRPHRIGAWLPFTTRQTARRSPASRALCADRPRVAPRRVEGEDGRIVEVLPANIVYDILRHPTRWSRRGSQGAAHALERWRWCSW